MIEAHNEVRTTFSFLTSQRSRGAEGEADHEQMLDVGTTGSGSSMDRQKISFRRGSITNSRKSKHTERQLICHLRI